MTAAPASRDSGATPPPPGHLGFGSFEAREDGAEVRRSRSATQMVCDLRTLGDELLADLRSIAPALAATPSLCPGWSVRDIVLHFVVGDERARAVLVGDDPFPDPTPDEAILMERSREWVAEQGDLPIGEAVERFAEARVEMLAAIDQVSDEDWGGYVPWGAQPITRFSMVQSRLMETWVHGWDARWPLAMPQPFDDRIWWIADMGVRHVPYSLMKSGLPVPETTISFELTGVGGGQWHRHLGGRREEATASLSPITVRGPAWAWIAWASQRHPGRAMDAYLASDGPGCDDVMRVARCFA